jgi:hypothetical protein
MHLLHYKSTLIAGRIWKAVYSVWGTSALAIGTYAASCLPVRALSIGTSIYNGEQVIAMGVSAVTIDHNMYLKAVLSANAGHGMSSFVRLGFSNQLDGYSFRHYAAKNIE